MQPRVLSIARPIGQLTAEIVCHSLCILSIFAANLWGQPNFAQPGRGFCRRYAEETDDEFSMGGDGCRFVTRGGVDLSGYQLRPLRFLYFQREAHRNSHV